MAHGQPAYPMHHMAHGQSIPMLKTRPRVRATSSANGLYDEILNNFEVIQKELYSLYFSIKISSNGDIYIYKNRDGELALNNDIYDKAHITIHPDYSKYVENGQMHLRINDKRIHMTNYYVKIVNNGKLYFSSGIKKGNMNAYEYDIVNIPVSNRNISYYLTLFQPVLDFFNHYIFTQYKGNFNRFKGGKNKKNERKCPKNPAKDFKLNTEKKGLDGKKWIVSKRSNGVKVWKRK